MIRTATVRERAYAGRRFRCKQCGETFTAEAASDTGGQGAEMGNSVQRGVRDQPVRLTFGLSSRYMSMDYPAGGGTGPAGTGPTSWKRRWRSGDGFGEAVASRLGGRGLAG